MALGTVTKPSRFALVSYRTEDSLAENLIDPWLGYQGWKVDNLSTLDLSDVLGISGVLGLAPQRLATLQVVPLAWSLVWVFAACG